MLCLSLGQGHQLTIAAKTGRSTKRRLGSRLLLKMLSSSGELKFYTLK
jgi:hypothetical protein